MRFRPTTRPHWNLPVAIANDRLLADYDTRIRPLCSVLSTKAPYCARYPRDVMQAAFEASKRDLCRARPRRILHSRRSSSTGSPYRTEAYRWFRVGEGTMDNFMFSALSAPPAAKGAPVKAAPAKG